MVVRECKVKVEVSLTNQAEQVMVVLDFKDFSSSNRPLEEAWVRPERMHRVLPAPGASGILPEILGWALDMVLVDSVFREALANLQWVNEQRVRLYSPDFRLRSNDRSLLGSVEKATGRVTGDQGMTQRGQLRQVRLGCFSEQAAG